MTDLVILLEAINQWGGVSADWVLVGVTSILGVIIVGMVKAVLSRLQKHEERLNMNDTQHARFEEQIKSGIETSNLINSQQDNKLEKIFRKLESMKV